VPHSRASGSRIQSSSASFALWALVFAAVSIGSSSLGLSFAEPARAETVRAPEPSEAQILSEEENEEEELAPAKPVANYQDSLIQNTLRAWKLTLDPSPEGKLIEQVRVARYDVVSSADPWPSLLNVFHKTTEEYIVTQELLFKKGDRWSQDFVNESERNLRAYLLVSVGEIIPVRGSADDRVVAVVIVKDIWSLRLEWDFSYVGGNLELLEADFSEQNLFGRNKRAGVNFRLDPASTSLGQRFDDPRILGTRLAMSESAGVIWNRDSGRPEGVFGNFSFGQPLYSLATEWAWNLAVNHRQDVFRAFSAGEIAELPVSTGSLVPYVIDRRRTDLSATVTRSYGRLVKRDLTFGWSGTIKRFELPDPPVSPISAATALAFKQSYLPRTESFGTLFANFRLFRTDFKQLIDIDTFALTEDFRFGPDISATVQIASPAFGFDSSFVRPSISADYNWFFGEHILSVGTDAATRYQPQTELASPWVNQILSFGMRHVSPRLGGFRLFSGARFTRRHNDLDRSQTFLGGGDLLRGYPSNYFAGPQSWSANFELRTRPTTIRTIHTGAALFVDMGDAADSFAALGLNASVGAGIRVLFPQFNRAVLRLDFAFPLQTLPAGDEASTLTAKFGQAF
jgi:hypothetical protein